MNEWLAALVPNRTGSMIKPVRSMHWCCDFRFLVPHVQWWRSGKVSLPDCLLQLATCTASYNGASAVFYFYCHRAFYCCRGQWNQCKLQKQRGSEQTLVTGEEKCNQTETGPCPFWLQGFIVPNREILPQLGTGISLSLWH